MQTNSFLWLNDFKKYMHQKVLLMLSGGKDSVCCLAILKEIGVSVEAIHFKHKWDWQNSHDEAHRAAKHFQVKLHEFDISEEFYEVVSTSTIGRPCRSCKPIMYVKAMNFANDSDFHWICVGDNASDTIVNRLILYESKRGNRNLFISEYLDCIERGIFLTQGLKILRPLIYTKSEIVEELLKNRYDYEVIKNFETGDKYFGYWREGCPIQYTDPDYKHSYDSLDLIKEMNATISDYAKTHHFRASFHYPSGVIITIPRGHEEEIKIHLENRGYQVPSQREIKVTDLHSYKLMCKGIADYYLHGKATIRTLAQRFAERVNIQTYTETLLSTHLGLLLIQDFELGTIIYKTENSSLSMEIQIDFAFSYEGENLCNIAYEVFKPLDVYLT